MKIKRKTAKKYQLLLGLILMFFVAIPIMFGIAIVLDEAFELGLYLSFLFVLGLYWAGREADRTKGVSEAQGDSGD